MEPAGSREPEHTNLNTHGSAYRLEDTASYLDTRCEVGGDGEPGVHSVTAQDTHQS